MASPATIRTIRRVRFIVGAPGWVFAVFCLAYAIGRLVYVPEPLLVVVATIGLPIAFVTLCWLGLAIIGSFFIYRYLCPSCGKPFFASNEPPSFMRLPFSVMFVTKCGHCGNPIRPCSY